MAKSLTCSVIIPAYNARLELKQCLQALHSGEICPDECIVVDDGSTDGTKALAESFGARVLDTAGRCGPAVARNTGATEARGDILFFIDADVIVHPDALSRVIGDFQDTSLEAVIGSYDDTPAAPGVVSQFRNLLHYYTHQAACRDATTFWSGCGAIRREIFLSVNGFDASYCRPAIEDIELGYRLYAAGKRLALDPAIQAKHLKHWTMRKMLRTDIFDRGIPWTLLILRAGRMPNDLNVKWHQRASVAAIGIVFLLAFVETAIYGGRFVTSLAALFMAVLGSFWVTEAVQPGRKLIRSALVAALASLFTLSYFLHVQMMAALVLGGYAFLFFREAVARVHIKWKRPLGLAYGLYLVSVLGLIASTLPRSIITLAVTVIAAMVIAINFRFYLFLLSHLGGLCGLAAIPLHVLYYVCGGFSFAVGFFRVILEKWGATGKPLP